MLRPQGFCLHGSKTLSGHFIKNARAASLKVSILMKVHGGAKAKEYLRWMWHGDIENDATFLSTQPGDFLVVSF